MSVVLLLLKKLTQSFFHRMAERPPYESKFPYSTAPNVVPKAFGETWEESVDEWGGFIKQA